MSTSLRQIGAFVLIALIALANPAHAFVDETCGELVRPTAVPRVADTPASPSDDGPGDGDQRAFDLGAQPVLLLNQACKPSPQSAPAPAVSRLIAVGREIGEIVARPRLEGADSDGMTLVCPRRHAGISLMPHGPPIAAA